MQIKNNIEQIDSPQGSAVALGYFDGVHFGHRAVIEAAVGYAHANKLTPAVFTFQLPGNHTLKGGRILSLTQKHERIASLGVEQCMEPQFEEFCTLTPEEFVSKVLSNGFHAKKVFCGGNFTFGARAAGNVQLLKKLCAEQGIRVKIVEMAQYNGLTVSSTRIRAALEEGRMDDVNAMLGAPYAIDWPVVHGKGLGSSKLGAPTINQNYPADALQPCSGVYITRMLIDGSWWPAATGIGPRPTVDKKGAAVTCETFVPGFEGDVYGQTPLLEFYRYLCPVRKFDSLQELQALIYDAAAQSTAYFLQKK